MRSYLGRLVGLLAAAAVVTSTSACATAFQDARLLAPGQVEITPSFNGAGITGGGDSRYLMNTFAVQGQVGVHDQLNVGIAYARLEDTDLENGVNGVLFGPRVGLVPDRVALSVPFSAMFGEGVDVSQTWQAHPMVLFTIPVSPRIDLNPSARVMLPLCGDCEPSDVLVGGNLGLGIRSQRSAGVTVRPEIGFLFNPGEDGMIWTFGVGMSMRR